MHKRKENSRNCNKQSKSKIDSRIAPILETKMPAKKNNTATTIDADEASTMAPVTVVAKKAAAHAPLSSAKSAPPMPSGKSAAPPVSKAAATKPAASSVSAVASVPKKAAASAAASASTASTTAKAPPAKAAATKKPVAAKPPPTTSAETGEDDDAVVAPPPKKKAAPKKATAAAATEASSPPAATAAATKKPAAAKKATKAAKPPVDADDDQQQEEATPPPKKTKKAAAAKEMPAEKEEKAESQTFVKGVSNAFMWFNTAWCEQNYTKESQEAKGLKYDVREAARLAGAAWRALSEEEQRPFAEWAEKDQERFRAEYRELYNEEPEATWRHDPHKPKKNKRKAAEQDVDDDEGDADAAGEGKKRGKKKAAKDPNAPKRPQYAYFLFSGERRPALVEELKAQVADGTLAEMPQSKDIVRMLGAEWKEMSDEQKAPYEEKSEIGKQKYKEDMAAYLANRGDADAEQAEDGEDGDGMDE